METLNSIKPKAATRHIACIAFLLLGFASPLLNAQTATGAANDIPAESIQRPKTTDKASEQLIQNYLTVTGGKPAHIALRNIVATGTIKEAGKLKSFRLIETQDGKRHLTYTWKHLGRTYETVYSFDGAIAWRQERLPKKQHPESYSGAAATHFIRQRWLIQPFILPLKADYVFQYQGSAKVGGRPTHVVVGYGKQNERTWFYFDKEKSLVIRWGGLGSFAGVKDGLDYRATRFESVDGVLLPKQIDLLAEDAPFGTITFESIQTNQHIDPKSFYLPPSVIPTLRQRTVQP